MKQIVAGLALTLLFPATGLAQEVRIPDRIEKLAAAAAETVNVTLDGPMLKLAGQFLNSNNADEQQAKAVVSKLNSIHVRSFEFTKVGEYSEADVAAFRAQLRPPAWSRIVDTTSKQNSEHFEIYVKQERNQVAGFVVIAAEPRELTIVSIDGAIDLKELSSLGGQFGIPKVNGGSTPAEALPSKTRPNGKDSAE